MAALELSLPSVSSSWLCFRRRLRGDGRLLRRPLRLTDLGTGTIQQVLEQLGVLHGHSTLGAPCPELTAALLGCSTDALPQRGRSIRLCFLLVRHPVSQGFSIRDPRTLVHAAAHRNHLWSSRPDQPSGYLTPG